MSVQRTIARIRTCFEIRDACGLFVSDCALKVCHGIFLLWLVAKVCWFSGHANVPANITFGVISVNRRNNGVCIECVKSVKFGIWNVRILFGIVWFCEVENRQKAEFMCVQVCPSASPLLIEKSGMN